MTERELTVEMELVRDYEFNVKLGEGFEELLMDEPEPLGAGKGPNASRVLSAAIGNCLSASLLFCLRKAKLPPTGIKTTVSTQLGRNDKGRLRIGGSRVTIQLGFDPDVRDKLNRCLQIFEDYCVVTASVRGGIPVEVEVTDGDGIILHTTRT